MTYGFIGLGNMATAIIGGMRRTPAFADTKILGTDISEEKTEAMRARYAVQPATAEEVFGTADTVLLAVKPQVLPTLLPAVSGFVRAGQLVISIAAGRDLAFYEGYLPAGTPVVRVMPNINAMVGDAAIALCGGKYATEEHLGAAEAVFRTVGETFRIREDLFSAFTALSGSSVAFAYQYIDFIARAGAAAGFSFETALEISAAAARGSAKMVSEGGIDPETLVKMVCSPGGTTIEGIKVLENGGYRELLTRAFDAVVARDRELRGV